MVCSTIILLLEWLWLYSLFLVEITLVIGFSSFCKVVMIFVLGNPFQLQGIQDHKHLQHLLELSDDSFYRCHSHASSSFLKICFMNYEARVVNHKLCLYSMSFLFSWIIYVTSSLINRSWYLLFCGIYERYKPWKVVFNFIWSSQSFCYVVYLLRYW